MFNVAYSRDLFYLSGYLSIFSFFLNVKNQTITKNLLPLAILLFGLSKIIWSIYYEPNHSLFNNVYDSYYDVGKRLIITSFIISFIINNNERNKEKLIRFIYQLMPFIAFAIAIYSAYQFHILGFERTELSTNRATSTAYMLSPILLLSLYCTIKNNTSFKNSLFLILTFIASIYSIFVTQTRAAILTFTLAALFMLAFKLTRKTRTIVLISLTLIITATTAINYEKIIKPRTEQAISEVVHFDRKKNNGSLGSRFTMWIAGIESTSTQPFGQSAEQRYQSIDKQIKNNEVSSEIYQFIDVHLHNEAIDTLSLQGVFGFIALILFYISLITFSLKEKNILLLSIGITIILYGLSDVLFFSQEVTVTYMSALALAIMIGKKHEHSSL